MVRSVKAVMWLVVVAAATTVMAGMVVQVASMAAKAEMVVWEKTGVKAERG